MRKISKSTKLHYMNLDALYQAQDMKTPYTPWPIDAWMLDQIKGRYLITGELCNQRKCR